MVKLHATEYTPLFNENEKGLDRMKSQRINRSLPSQRVLALVIVFETVLIICGVLSTVTNTLIENAAGRNFIPQKAFVDNEGIALHATWHALGMAACGNSKPSEVHAAEDDNTISPQFEDKISP